MEADDYKGVVTGDSAVHDSGVVTMTGDLAEFLAHSSSSDGESDGKRDQQDENGNQSASDLLQNLMRARQRRLEERSKRVSELTKNLRECAACEIQRLWRGIRDRKQYGVSSTDHVQDVLPREIMSRLVPLRKHNLHKRLRRTNVKETN